MEPTAPLDRAVLAGLLDQEGLDALLICRPWDVSVQPNVSYLVGHLTPPWDYSGLFVLLPREGDLAVVANAWCRDDPSGTIALHRYPGHHLRFALPVLAALLGERGLATARLGIEATRLPAGLFDELRAALPGAAFAAGNRVLARLRMRKSAAEVGLIRRAIAAEEGVRVAQAALAPGRPLAVIAAAVGAVVHPDGGRVISAHVTSYRPDGSEALALPQRILRRSAGLGSGTYAGRRCAAWPDRAAACRDGSPPHPRPRSRAATPPAPSAGGPGSGAPAKPSAACPPAGRPPAADSARRSAKGLAHLHPARRQHPAHRPAQPQAQFIGEVHRLRVGHAGPHQGARTAPPFPTPPGPRHPPAPPAGKATLGRTPARRNTL